MRALNIERLAVAAEGELFSACRGIDPGQQSRGMAVVGMGRQAEGVCVFDGSLENLDETGGSDGSHFLCFVHSPHHVVVVLLCASFPERVLHSEAVDIHKENGEDKLPFGLAPRDRQGPDPAFQISVETTAETTGHFSAD